MPDIEEILENRSAMRFGAVGVALEPDRGITKRCAHVLDALPADPELCPEHPGDGLLCHDCAAAHLAAKDDGVCDLCGLPGYVLRQTAVPFDGLLSGDPAGVPAELGGVLRVLNVLRICDRETCSAAAELMTSG